MNKRRKYNPRSIIAAAHDAAIAAASFVLALYVRLGDDQFYLASPYLLPATIFFTVICVGSFAAMRLYRGLWRFASMRDMIEIAKASSLAVLIFAVFMFILTRLDHFPRSALFINWLLLMSMLAAPRFAYRALKDRTLTWEMTLEEKAKIPVLLVGATSLAEQFIQDMSRNPRAAYQVVGILDNDTSRHNRMIQRTRIYGSTKILDVVLRKLTRKDMRPHKILIADPNLAGAELEAMMLVADAEAIPVARIPRLSDFRAHFDDKLQVKPIAIEDLLGRPQMALDRTSMRALIAGKRVLITGAGGSIGSELSRQIKGYDPAKLVLLDACEFNLYQIGRELAAANPTCVLGDVRDAQLINHIVAEHKPEIVFHAAAIKHVPLSEENPEEAMLTNIFGSKNVADACVAHGVSYMVMISTDKAVNPTNVMGATKKLAESYCQALAQTEQAKTHFVTVRFGNVLGSTGSVVPLFQEQIARGGPVTVTHAEMTRYFMTIREAVELVLQAASIGAAAKEKREHIFVLDMGRPIKILSLAEQMIRLAGFKPYTDIPIEFTGLRAGEKMHEELFHEAEGLAPTPHASISLASPRITDYSELSSKLESLLLAAKSRHRAQAVVILKTLVPEYNPLSNVA